jgi:hypothetical protein
MKAQEEILHSINILHKKANKYSNTKQESSARQVSESRSHIKGDDHGNDRKSRSMIRHHNSLRKSTRKTHAISGLGSIPSLSPIRR